MLKVADLAYAAGVIDSDGSISIIRIGVRRRTNPDWAIVVSVSQVNTAALGHFHELFGGSLTCGRAYKLWRWQVSYRRAVGFLEAIRPYLRIKQKQADLALAFHVARQVGPRRTKLTQADVDLREGFAVQMQQLNLLSGRVAK